MSPCSTAPLFALRGVSKSFGRTTAVHTLNLDIPAEKTTVLIGPSGCGKSTLLRLMIGLIRPDGGSVEFENQSLSPENAPLLRQRMGYVIQDGGLFPHMTARDNAALMAQYLRWDSDRITARLGELIELTHFPKAGLDRYPGQLSGGQRQRVSLMRALMLDPDVLLMDEPLGALDPMIRRDLQQELRTIFRQLNKTVIMVTHDLGEAGYFADMIILMRAGHILQLGAYRELLDSPADEFVAEFVNAQRSPLVSEGAE